MADALRFGGFTLDRAGIIEISKSAAVQSALGSIASSMANRANAEASTRISDEDATFTRNGHEIARKLPYEAEVKAIRRTAIGIVSTTGEQGMRDQSLNHTLDGLNH